MSLAKYKQKRRFNETPEPEGKEHKASKRLQFVIQKHHASHLHYDLRLEMDGVMKSWAVPKGPSLNPSDKRLAMHVEDHPIEYNKFEGVIPEGNYGAGNVIIWDRGWYETWQEKPDWPATPQVGYKKGDFKFIIHGEKLQGAFALVKIKNPREAGKRDNSWLLIKHKDEYSSDKDITKEDKSVVSGRRVDDLSNDDRVDLSDASEADMPSNVQPMLATLVNDPFDDKEWLYEIKWDGYRAIAAWDGKKLDLYSRNGNDFCAKYPPLREALRELPHKVVLDGEIVAVDEEGHAHFEWLQNWGRIKQGQLVYYAFDILWLDGHDLRDRPLKRRKEVLKKILPEGSAVRYSDHIEGQGTAFFKSAESQQLEGIMAKRADSTYKEGFRSKQWLKIKTHLRQEAVIGGFTEPRGGRKYIGALILGVYKNGQLTYVGHTGGGIPPNQMKSLRQELEEIEIDKSPFANKFRPNATAHWVEPKLLCEVRFAEWTADGHMRQPIFIGMRSDKDAEDVTTESAKETKAMIKKSATKSQADKLELSHLDKVFFPKAGYTKGDLAEYYKSVAEFILPYIKDRPHSLLRHPNGVNGPSFFQKDVEKHPDWIKTKAIYSEANEKDIHYMVPENLDHLLYMVQLGCIEINPWNSTAKYLHNPDWLVIDLDPETIEFKYVVETALCVKKVCDELKIPNYPKTSGKTGIHIYMPLSAKYDYDQVKTFAEILANIINERTPEHTSIVRQPKNRQHKVYVDFLQNRQGQTLAAPYSVRPTDVASVSTPLHWDEVNGNLDPAKYTIKNTVKRLGKTGDLWKPVLGKGIDLKKVLDSVS